MEQALNRIAFALDRGRPDPVAAPAADTQAVDLHALAANIDILIARIRDVIGDDVLQQDGPPHDEDR
nr:hypothetical protein [Gluconacetobacter azotocaptans]